MNTGYFYNRLRLVTVPAVLALLFCSAFANAREALAEGSASALRAENVSLDNKQDESQSDDGASKDESHGDSDLLVTAESDIVDTGISGSCTWTIDLEGNLVIRPSEGDEGVLGDRTWYRDHYEDITTVRFEGTVHATNCSSMFAGCWSLVSVNLSGLETSSVSDFSYMFWRCYALEHVDLSDLNTSNATDISFMFSECSSLEYVDLSSIDTNGATDDWMFEGSEIKTIVVGENSASFGPLALVLSDNDQYDQYPTTDRYASNDIWITESDGTYHTRDQFGDMHSADKYTRVDGWLGCGSCMWNVDEQGMLTVKPVNGVEGTLDTWDTCVLSDYKDLGGDTYDFHDASYHMYAKIEAPWYENDSIKSIRFEGTVHAQTCSEIFSGLSNLKEIDFTGFDTSSVRDMSYMFRDCSELKQIDLTAIDTSSLEDSHAMFEGCESLVELDTTLFDVSRDANLGAMFSGCSSLRSIDISGWDTSSAKEMGFLFNGCTALRTLDVSQLDTSNVCNMRSMFDGCSSLRVLDLSGFDTSSVESMRSMFSGCSGLQSLDVGEWDTSKVEDMRCMFLGCSRLQSLNPSRWDTSSVENMSQMFKNCSRLLELDLSNWDVSSVNAGGDGSNGNTNSDNRFGLTEVFSGCTLLKSLDLSNWHNDFVTDLSSLFEGCSSLTSLNTSGWSFPDADVFTHMFSGCSSLSSIDASALEAAYVLNSDDMFSDCSSLVSLDISGLKTSAFESCYAMFSGCSSLSSVDVAGWDTSKVSSFERMFYNCSSLRTIEVDNWDVSHADSLGYMFSGCASLTALDLSSWDICQVTWMPDMFSGCSSLRSLDIAGWDTSLVTDMTGMFNGCSSVSHLDLSSFDTSLVDNHYWMFNDCSSLTSISVGPKYLILDEDMFPDAPFTRGWWSVADGCYYSKGDVVSGRSGIADTYLAMDPAAPFFLDARPGDDRNHGTEVDWMGRSGISTGWEVAGGREFRGMRDVKRCDFAAFLYRLADLSDDGERNDSCALPASRVREVLAGVSDCSPSTSHAPEIAWMVDSGISRGWPDRGGKTVSFRPMANVARQDMAAFLYRFADLSDDGRQDQSLEPGAESVAFRDVRHGDAGNHAPEVEWLASVGVTKGWQVAGGAYEFRGRASVKRQDMAAFLYRLNAYLNR